MDLTEWNRRIVVEYFEMTFGSHRPESAAERYLAPDYVHHGSGSGSTRDAFVRYFTEYFRIFPEFGFTILKCVANSDSVALHVWVRPRPDEAGQEVAEFYRLKDGKISEHWHVIGPPSEGGMKLQDP